MTEGRKARDAPRRNERRRGVRETERREREGETERRNEGRKKKTLGEE